MEKKINIAELLKDCPKGMELDCLMYDNVTFVSVVSSIHTDYPIRIKTESGFRTALTEYGQNVKNEDAKCVIFPKGKTTWEGFQRPFKDGDIIYNRLQKKICVYYLCKDRVHRIKDCRYNESNKQLQFEKLEYPIPIAIQDYRLATEEEKQKLFDAIKENGYKWNEENKTLEKLVYPRFKVGDRIWCVCKHFQYDVTELTDTHYTLVEVESKFKYTEPICEDKNWELVPNKFDINTLVPFESRVLVRNSCDGFWMPTFWGIYEAEKANRHLYRNYLTTKGFFLYCIPYNDDTKHLVGKTDDCDDYYKTWE